MVIELRDDESDYKGQPDLRMNFTLFKDEFPLLAEELLNVTKGRARKSRLASLATTGLLVELGRLSVIVPGSIAPAAPTPAAEGSSNTGYVAQLSIEQVADLCGSETQE